MASEPRHVVNHDYGLAANRCAPVAKPFRPSSVVTQFLVSLIINGVRIPYHIDMSQQIICYSEITRSVAETAAAENRKSNKLPGEKSGDTGCETGAQFMRMGCDIPPMLKSLRRLSVIALMLVSCGLSGCGTVNGYLAAGMSDYIPHWAGGLPPDAPPRPGTAKYDAFMQERERKRFEPPPPKEEADKTSPPSLDPVH